MKTTGTGVNTRLSTIRRWQIALITSGLMLLAVGGIALLRDVTPTSYLGIVLWFAAAIVVHDGIIAPLTFLVALLLRRIGRRIPLAVVLISQGALVIGAVLGLIVVPEIHKKTLGTKSFSILPLDYAGNLTLFSIGLVLATALAIAGYFAYRAVARRQKLRPSRVQV
ncbi:MAG: hypothetical protein H7248_09855 [Microbacteriaceae bacterium]|nr:hypothetical protein [Microbacteriaceae bacterium]